jgi:hypothetical protein
MQLGSPLFRVAKYNTEELQEKVARIGDLYAPKPEPALATPPVYKRLPSNDFFLKQS